MLSFIWKIIKFLVITGFIGGFIIACLTIRGCMSDKEVVEMKEQYRKDTIERNAPAPTKKKRKRIHELK